MKALLPVFFLSSLTVAACQTLPPPDVAPSTEKSVTDIQVAYIVLEDNGANGPLVGCGDSEVLSDYWAQGDLNAKERIAAGLENLFLIKDQYYGPSNLYNAVYQSSLTVDSVTVSAETVTVAISGTTQLGGECDNPRFVAQIRGTVKNNLDSDSNPTLIITLNGEPLEKIQDLSGQ